MPDERRTRRVLSYYDDRRFLVHDLQEQTQRGDWIGLGLLTDDEAAAYGATRPGVTDIAT
jgi:hypothetical protein